VQIAFIHPSWPGDEGTGATHTATQVVTGLADRGHDVTVYCPDDPPDGAENAPYTLETLNVSGFPYHTNTQLNRAIREVTPAFDDYDLTNCYLPAGLPAMEHVARKTSTATGVTLNAYGAVCPKNDLLYRDETQCDRRGLARCLSCLSLTSPGHDEFSAPYRMVSRLGNYRLVRQGGADLSVIDCFRSPSAHVKTNHVDFGFPADRISVVPHPLNDAFLVDHRSDFEEPYRLLYVGFLERQKGVETLIPVLSALRERLDEQVTLTVVGDGGRRSAMERQASELGVTDAVTFRGFVPNERLPSVYAAHDLFIYPGIWEEPLARVYLEALATGTPVVSTEYGSVASILGDGGVTTDGSVDGFVSAVAGLLRDGRLPDLSDGARRKADGYRLDRVIPQIESIYRTAVERAQDAVDGTTSR